MLYLLSSVVWTCRHYCVFVACLFSFTSLGTYYVYHSQTPFQNQTDRIGNRFEIPVYTNIIYYSLIIYICSMYVVYFMQNFIMISSFSSFPHSIICNPVCCDEKCFIFFPLFSGLVDIIVFLLLACSPSLLRALIIFIIIRPL